MPEIMINGQEGRIEARYSAGANENAPAIMLLHPHPEYGGTMNNRVICELYQHFNALGCDVLRFNFRGAGRSQGKFSKGEGELADAATALDWLQKQHNNTRQSWVVGFSFGAWIGLQLLMRRPEVVGFISVATPVNLYDFNFLSPCPASGVFIHGDSDQVVPLARLEKLMGRVKLQKGVEIDHRIVAGADHFFSSKIDLLRKEIDSYLAQRDFFGTGSKPQLTDSLEAGE